MSTPETDQNEYVFENHDSSAGETLRRVCDGVDVSDGAYYEGPSVPSLLARRLERERDEARREAEAFRDDMGVHTMPSAT